MAAAKGVDLKLDGMVHIKKICSIEDQSFLFYYWRSNIPNLVVFCNNDLVVASGC